MHDVDPTATSSPSGRSEPEEAGRPATSGSGSSSSPSGGGTSRLEKVSAKDLCDFKGEHQLLSVMLGAIVAHQRLHQDAGILHGDINPNTIVMLETEDGDVEGAPGGVSSGEFRHQPPGPGSKTGGRGP